ncbi:hypothetical protein [Miltoncostaea marina]|uniref:hypothetical protein n=1 Tax=Miltoncostaea marina TaxID=2843215 RepID=UPI001C3DADE8|nr:hypothetical protein [Miltoncostaea marina]
MWAELLTRLARSPGLRKGRTLDPSMPMVDARVPRGGRAGPSSHEPGGRGGGTNGVRRTLPLDITGSPVAVRVDPARPHDVRVARELLGTVIDAMPAVRAIVADRGSRGLAALCRRRGLQPDTTVPPKGASRLTPLRPLWRIGDAFVRLGRRRRLSRSYEGSAASARAWMEIAACEAGPAVPRSERTFTCAGRGDSADRDTDTAGAPAAWADGRIALDAELEDRRPEVPGDAKRSRAGSTDRSAAGVLARPGDRTGGPLAGRAENAAASELAAEPESIHRRQTEARPLPPGSVTPSARAIAETRS